MIKWGSCREITVSPPDTLAAHFGPECVCVHQMIYGLTASGLNSSFPLVSSLHGSTKAYDDRTECALFWLAVIRFRPSHLASGSRELVPINNPFIILFPPVKMTVLIFRDAILHLLLIWSTVLCMNSVNESDFFHNISDLVPGKNIPFQLRGIPGRSRSTLMYLRGDFQFMPGDSS